MKNERQAKLSDPLPQLPLTFNFLNGSTFLKNVKGLCKDKGTLEPINTIRASVLKKIC